MPFVTYENYQNQHVTIHNEGCGQISKNGGKEDYHNFENIDDAENYAKSTKLPVIYCSFCNPKKQCNKNS